MTFKRHLGWLALYGLLCALEGLVQWAKGRVAERLNPSPPPGPTP